MTEAEHNRPIPKFSGNRPSASAAEVFGLQSTARNFTEHKDSP